MSVLSTPLRNEIASQKDIFRLAATIYSETSDVVSDAEAQLQIIKCMFAAIGNEYLDKNEIIAKLLDIYKYHISEDEVDAIIRAYLKTKYSCAISTKSKWKRDGQTQERTRRACHSE